MIELGTPALIGLGTSECEALSSYIQRLSAANGTFPGQLVHRVLGWLEEGNLPQIGGWCPHPKKVYLGRNANAFRLAANWLGLLQRITAKMPLSLLTTRSWDLAFSPRGFLHQTLRWCPLCLAADAVPYHRLLWMLAPVNYCDVHGGELARICGRCGRPPPVLHDRSMTVICPRCGWDLRRCTSVPDLRDSGTGSELAIVVRHFSAGAAPTTWRSQAAIRELCHYNGIAHPAQLARAVGTSRLSAWYWWSGNSSISLPMALHVYSRLGCSFSAALIGNEAKPVTFVQPHLHLRGRKPARRLDWREIGMRMRSILERPLAIAPTFLSVSQELDIERRTLRAHLAPLCRRISQRFVQRQKLERKQREVTLARRMNDAIDKLRSSGRVPRQFLVEEVLQQPGLFNRHYARRLLARLTRGE